MGIVASFISSVKDLVRSGYKLDRDQRNEIALIVGELATELERALTLTIAYLDGARVADDPASLARYLRGARSKMGMSFNEFQVCHGIRRLNDRLDRWFDPLRGSVSVGAYDELRSLIDSLETGERLIFDELSNLFARLDDLAQEVEYLPADEYEAFRRQSLPSVVNLERVSLLASSTQVRDVAREIQRTM